MAHDYQIPIPRQWCHCIKSSFIHTISLASAAFTSTCALAAKQKESKTRLKAELAQAYQEIALLKEELSIKDARFSKVLPHRRPFYTPIQRFQILKLRAVRRWTIAKVAETFHLNAQTVISWMKRLDEGGEKALLQLKEPVNKFPDFVGAIVRQLKVFFPGMGKVKIAQVLSRAGLHLGVTSVGRMWKQPIKNFKEEVGLSEDGEKEKVRIVPAKYPGHVIHLDLTVVPTAKGFWVPWLHQSWSQVWPFCWWLGWVVDHYSRYVIGFAVFKKKPTTKEVCLFLKRAFRKAKMRPKHIITDKDKPFDCDAFKEWCRRRNINPRYGAIGKHGSLAVVERFIRSMKQEVAKRILVPFKMDAMRWELIFYAAWYNEYRPHTYLSGKTPKEVYEGLVPANTMTRYEPRSRWPRGSPCASPQTNIKGKRGAKLVLEIRYMEDRKHLPVIELKPVA